MRSMEFNVLSKCFKINYFVSHRKNKYSWNNMTLVKKNNASVTVTSWSALESHQTALHIRLLSFPHNTHCLDSSFIITFTCLIILFSSPHISLVFSFIICKVLLSVTLQFRDRERSTRRDLDLGLYFEQNTIVY